MDLKELSISDLEALERKLKSQIPPVMYNGYLTPKTEESQLATRRLSAVVNEMNNRINSIET